MLFSSSRQSPPPFAYLFERFPSFVQTFVYREVDAMRRLGSEPTLISIRTPDDAESLREPFAANVTYLPEADVLRGEVDVLRAKRKWPSRIHRAIPEWRQKPDSNRLFEAVWLGQMLREQRVRHVHAHFGGIAARAAWLCQHLWGIPYSFTGHANDIFCDTAFPVTREMLVRDARLVVTETIYARDWLRQRHPDAAGHIHEVYNGIDFTPFPTARPIRHSNASPTLRILSVGRYIPKKGFDDLLGACALLRERGIPFQCKIVGGGPLSGNLSELAHRLHIESSVEIAGPRSQSDVRQFLAETDVFVLASKRDSEGGSDNLPTVIMEAMAARLPVVSTRVAGIPEMVAHGETGILVTEGDVPALAAALARYQSEPVLQELHGEAGRARAESLFALPATVGRLRALLQKFAGVRFDTQPRGLPWLRRLIGRGSCS
jgi:glycosyltransferase involved in cell wall biosynthesis